MKLTQNVLYAIIIFGIGFMLVIALFGETLGLSRMLVDVWCWGYCAIKIKMPWGSPLGLPVASLPGGFCGC